MSVIDLRVFHSLEVLLYVSLSCEVLTLHGCTDAIPRFQDYGRMFWIIFPIREDGNARGNANVWSCRANLEQICTQQVNERLNQG